jgi:NAD+--asparagine ADP-ribosyltransferase
MKTKSIFDDLKQEIITSIQNCESLMGLQKELRYALDNINDINEFLEKQNE